MICLWPCRGWVNRVSTLVACSSGPQLIIISIFRDMPKGGFSGDLQNSGNAISLYQRMPHLISMNPTQQAVPRLKMPEAIMDGKAEGYPIDIRSIEGQFFPVNYPSPGHSKVKMMYKYGGSYIGTQPDSNRYVKMYQSDELSVLLRRLFGTRERSSLLILYCQRAQISNVGISANGLTRRLRL